MYTVYGDMLSGNCYKVKLLMKFLDIKHKWIHIDILNKETHTDEFLALNPNGKIPVLACPDGKYLSESNAILNYLAEGSELIPSNKFERAKALEWQFFEQYSHEPYIAVARYINIFLGLPEQLEQDFRNKQTGGHKALNVMNKQLEVNKFIVGSKLTLADISLYAYTHVAEEGGFKLTQYNNVQRWLEDFKTIPGYIAMSRDNADL